MRTITYVPPELEKDLGEGHFTIRYFDAVGGKIRQVHLLCYPGSNESVELVFEPYLEIRDGEKIPPHSGFNNRKIHCYDNESDLSTRSIRNPKKD